MSANRIRAVETVRNWNANFPPGTVVIFEGTKCKTSGPAGLGLRDEPSVFLDEHELPIPLVRLDVPGYHRTAWRRTNERPLTPESKPT